MSRESSPILYYNILSNRKFTTGLQRYGKFTCPSQYVLPEDFIMYKHRPVEDGIFKIIYMSGVLDRRRVEIIAI